MWFLGLLSMALGGLLFWSYHRKKDRLLALTSTQTSTVEHLCTLARSMAEGVGQGSLAFVTEVCGRVRAAEPLLSELAEKPCVYYDMQVQREVEETYVATDSKGRRERRTRRASETVASNRRSITFEVEDATGHIEVDPAGAEIIAEKVLSRFEPATAHGGRLRVGRLDLELPSASGPGRRTLGYRYEERLIPVDREIYVLGEASDEDGRLRIRRPAGGDDRFLVSVKSEAQLVHELESSLKTLRIVAVVFLLAGVALLVFGLI